MDAMTPLPLRALVVWFVGSLGLSVGLWLCVGSTLGLFFGGLVLAGLLAPFAAAGQTGSLNQLLAGGMICDGVAAVWLVMTMVDPGVALPDWIGAYLVLLALILAELSLWRLTLHLGIGPSAEGVAILAFGLWLTAPVWLLHHLSQTLMQKIIDLHPLFAINSIIQLGVWTESPGAYRIMNLNQDVFYAMPSSSLNCILVHGASGLVLLGLMRAKIRS